MMYIDLSDSEKELKEAARHFVEQEILPFEKKALANGSLDEKEIARLRTAAVDLGIYAANIPKKFGGGGRSFAEISIIGEELGKALPYLRQIFRSPPRILFHLNEKLVNRYLKPSVQGRKICGMAWEGTDPEVNGDGFSTSAESQGERWILNGGKYLVDDAEGCDFFVIFAAVAEEAGSEPFAFIVDRDSPGLHFLEDESVLRTDGIRLSCIQLSDCSVPSANLLGEIGQGSELFPQWLEEERLIRSATCLGLAQRCLQEARRHSIRKKIGAKPIALRQGVQWKLADMAVEIHGLRLVLYNVASEMDSEMSLAEKLQILRWQSSETAAKVADMALSILGGEGMVQSSPMAAIIEGARASKYFPRSTEFLKASIAKDVFESV